MSPTLTSDEKIILSEKQIGDFEKNGFISVDQISSPEEIIKLREIFERLFRDGAGRHEGAQYDMVSHDEDDKNARPTLPQIINPVSYAPELRDTLFRKNALEIARQLLGPKATPTFEHAILKPGGYGAATPWHQDEAFRSDDSFNYTQVSIWMPLQPATPENGCLQYIPQNNGQILPHRSFNNDPKIHSIECAEGFDPADAILCPLEAGGATAHSGRTLHSAGPNFSKISRYAYVLAFELPPQPNGSSRNFYWNKNKETADVKRRRAWRKRGGVVIEIIRKFQGGVWKRPDRVLFEVRRAVRALFSRKK